MIDPKKLLTDFLGSNVPGTGASVAENAEKAKKLAKDNPLATGALVAILAGTGAGRAVAGSALKLGGLAAIAGLGYHAYQNYKNGKTPGEDAAPQEMLPPPEDTSFHPAQSPQGEDEFAVAVLQAMIAAARADGHVDDKERQKIADRLSMSGLGGDAEQFIMGELAKPVDLDSIVSSARTDAQKVEIYTASRIVISEPTRAERGYLDMLAGRLKLPDALVDHIDATVQSAAV